MRRPHPLAQLLLRLADDAPLSRDDRFAIGVTLMRQHRRLAALETRATALAPGHAAIDGGLPSDVIGSDGDRARR